MEPCSRMGPIPAEALQRCWFLAQLGRLLLASRCPIGPRLATAHAAFLAVRSALSAAYPDRAVLGRQRHRRPQCRRAYRAGHAVLCPVGDSVPDRAAVRMAASQEGLP